MKKLKKMKLFISLFALFITANIFGQQLPQFSQYMFNQYAYNPAYSGSLKNWEVTTNNRYQWVGITDAPRTFTLSTSGPLKSKKLSMGGYLYTDIVGPTRRIGFQSSLAYSIFLTKGIQLSFGLSLGFNQWMLDADKITTHDPDDIYFSNGLLRSFDPDGKFGLYFKHDDWYLGASIEQVFHDKLSFLATQTSSESYLEDHYYVNAGYNLGLGQKWEIQPSALLKLGPPAPIKLDVNLRVTYNQMIWAGVGFRTQDALIAMLGFKYNDMLSFGYAYDITNTELKKYSSGSHEILMGIRFGKSKRN